MKRELTHLTGTIGSGKKAVTYDKADFRYKNVDIDGELLQSFADDFGVDKKSKDGVSHELFPLRTELLPRYTFELTGSEKWHDRDAFPYRLQTVRKARRSMTIAGREKRLIDKAEFQPLMITSHLACKIPVLVKTMLGTNVKQVGFKVTYQKFDDGIWFPVTYGGEFQFRARLPLRAQRRHRAWSIRIFTAHRWIPPIKYEAQ